jgi:NAD(P)-dependent dehydrogenase (short-subunit alcohol dehydrogenase family)
MNVRYRVELSQTERTELTALLSGGKQVARKLKRAQILLAADAGASDAEIARSVGVGGSNIHPVALQVTGNLGGLDALINSASSLGPTSLVPLADTECEDLEQALMVNLMGPFRLTKALFGALAASAGEGRGAVVINISSDAAVHAYSGWGAYGSSKAALHHLTAIWSEEAKAEGVAFLSLDPGDMDTPLHALAVPDADPTTLRRPEDAAAEIVDSLLAALPSQAAGPLAVRP